MRAIRACLAAFVATGLLISSEFLGRSAFGAENEFSGSVMFVIQGDKLTVKHGNEMSYIHLDGVVCPEKDKPFGREARGYVQDATLVGKVKVSYLGNCSLSSSSENWTPAKVICADGSILNVEVVKRGFGQCVDTSGPAEAIRDELKSAENQARKDRLGIWSTMPVPEAKVSPTVVPGSESGKQFSRHIERSVPTKESEPTKPESPDLVTTLVGYFSTYPRTVLVVGGLLLILLIRRKMSRKRAAWTANRRRPLAGRRAAVASAGVSRVAPQAIPASGGGWVINPYTTFPLTLYGADRSAIDEIKQHLDGKAADNGVYAVTELVAPVLARSYLRCREVDEYIARFKPQYVKRLNELIQASPEWPSASPEDREGLLDSFSAQSLHSLEILLDCDVQILFEGDSVGVALNDALIQSFGYEAISAYVRDAYALDAVHFIPPNSYERKYFEALAGAGLAWRGSDIALPGILHSLTLKQLDELAKDFERAPFRKKDKAVEILLGVPDILQRVQDTFGLASFFQLTPLPNEFSGVDLRAVGRKLAYFNEVAYLIAHTYIMAKPVQEEDPIVEGLIAGYEVSSRDDDRCCPFCRRMAGKKFPRSKCPKTPFHLACRCILIPVMKGEMKIRGEKPAPTIEDAARMILEQEKGNPRYDQAAAERILRGYGSRRTRGKPRR